SPTGSGESVLTMETSALVRAVTRFDVDAESLLVIVCAVVVLMVEVMFSVVPLAVVVLTCTCGANVAVAPTASDAMVQVIVPPAPTAGVPHDHPAGTASERKFAPAGSGMESETFAAALMPLFVAVPPTLGVMHVHPAGGVMLWKVVFGGVVKLYVGVFAGEPPRFETVSE